MRGFSEHVMGLPCWSVQMLVLETGREDTQPCPSKLEFCFQFAGEVTAESLTSSNEGNPPISFIPFMQDSIRRASEMQLCKSSPEKVPSPSWVQDLDV